MQSTRELLEEAHDAATRGLDGDHGDHESRMRLITYAGALATIAGAQALEKIAQRGIQVDTGLDR